MLALCVVYVHTVKLCREQGCLIAACTCADLQDDILIIVRVFRQQQDLQFLLQLLHALLGIGKFLFGKLAHLLVALLFQKCQAVFDVLLCLLVGLVCLYQRRQVSLLLHELAETVLVFGYVRLA